MERRVRWGMLLSSMFSPCTDLCRKAYSEPVSSNPTIHLPHLLRVLGPSSLTLYKHVLGRKRILIYTLPPVEVASILCQVAGDICYEAQATSEESGRLKGKHREPINVLGMVTLVDLDRLEAESRTGRGWIACEFRLSTSSLTANLKRRHDGRDLHGETILL